MTSSRTGSLRSASVGSSASRRSSRSGWSRTRAVSAALGARHRADVDRVELRPRPVGPAALREPVHDRVAAVDEHDEEDADAVGGRAPQRGDLVERGAVADDGQHRAVLPRDPHADRRGHREAEHPHRADEAERLGRRDARVQLRAARRRLLEQDRVVRQALGQRGEHVAGAHRLAGLRRRRRGRALAGRPGGGGASVDRLGQRGADRGRLAEHGEVDRAAVGLRGVLRDDGDARARLDERPFVIGVLPEGARPHDEEGVVGAEHLAQPRPPGRQVPGEARMVLREAGLASERLLPHRAAEALRERTSAAQPAAPSAPAPATIAGASAARAGPRARRPTPGRRRSSAAAWRGRGSRAAPAPARSSRPSGRSRSPGRGRWRPRGRRGRSRPARPARGRAGRPRRGSRPPGRAGARPGTAPARGGGGPAGRR